MKSELSKLILSSPLDFIPGTFGNYRNMKIMPKPKAKTDSSKRQNGNDANAPQKRQRTSSSTDTAAMTPSSPEPKKIFDLNDDCLEKIFGHLDLHSLFSVAVANEWLRPAANVVYKHKFSDKVINFHDVDVDSNTHGNFGVCFEKVSFHNFKVCLQFLRCFGSSLSNVHIYYRFGSNSNRYDYIHQYLNKYCADTLLELELVEKPRFLIKHFDKPFVNVRTVALHYCHLGEQFPLISQWFPNARTFKLHSILMDDRWIDLPFQHLERVRIDVNNGVKRNGFTRNEAAHLLRSCRQLKSLVVQMPSGRQGMALNTLLNIIEEKPALEVLALMMDKYCTTPKPTEIQRLINEHPLIVELDLMNFKFTIDNALDLLRQLNRLKTFCFQLTDPSEYLQIGTRLDGTQWNPFIRREFGTQKPRYVQVIRRI